MYKLDHGHNGWHIKAFIITMMNNNQSVVSTRKLLYSISQGEKGGSASKVQPFITQATIPETIDHDLKQWFHQSYWKELKDSRGQIRYTWPKTSVEDGIDFGLGLYKRAYAAADWKKVAACTISHMRLWQHCIDINEPILILEHDAYFVRTFSYRDILMAGQEDDLPKPKYVNADADPYINKSPTSEQWTGGICSINDPAGATRRASVYIAKLNERLKGKNGLVTVPYVDGPGEDPLPSGLPGNSAYVIKPWAAKKLLEKTLEVGIWPNDALMCRQFFPWLQAYYKPFTVVQGTPSTTTT